MAISTALGCQPVARIDDLLAKARTRLERLDPEQARDALAKGARLIDIRGDYQRAADGEVPGAVHVPRNVLEWRLDPECDHRDEALARPDATIVLMCNEGYQSSLAAATLQDLGLPRATDLEGGFQAWRAAGLPVEKP
jgi:rhodanese-related sulfurtransferase